MGSYKGNNITKKMPSTDVCVNFLRNDFITKSTKHSVENESGKKLIDHRHRHRRRHYYYPARTIMCP